MPTTKKTSAVAAAPAKTAKPRVAEAAVKSAAPKAASPARTSAAAALEEAAAQARAAAQAQMKSWEEGVRFFSQKKFSDAASHFDGAAAGPAAHIADKARSYAQICRRKFSTAEVNLQTADDHFNYGVERMNARDIGTAREHLSRALALEPKGEHILVTLALCCGLAGDGDGACEHLKQAIDLDGRNRILARQDPEFAVLAQQMPALRALLMSDMSESV